MRACLTPLGRAPAQRWGGAHTTRIRTSRVSESEVVMNGKRHTVRVHERDAPFRLHCGWLSCLLGILLLTACQGDAGTAPTTPSSTKFSAVAASGHASCALTTDGVVYCWGDVSLGIDLVGTLVSNTPVRFDRQGALRFASLSVGGHAYLRTHGGGYCLLLGRQHRRTARRWHQHEFVRASGGGWWT